MANRRMFSLDIVDTDSFLDMPVSAQALYFHLGMRADDDGFVSSPRKITGLVGCNPDDIKILITKNLVIPFDNGVLVIADWKVNNYIPKDRYKPTQYIEEKDVLTAKENGSYTIIPNSYTECIQDVSSLDTQVRLGKDSIGKDIVSKDTICSTDVQLIMSEWNKTGVNPIKGITAGTNRYKMLTARIKQHGTDIVVEAVQNVNHSPFLQGQNKQGWMITFDWFVKPNNFIKVLEGNYSDRDKEEPEHGNNIRVLSANEIAERIQQGG